MISSKIKSENGRSNTRQFVCGNLRRKSRIKYAAIDTTLIFVFQDRTLENIYFSYHSADQPDFGLSILLSHDLSVSNYYWRRSLNAIEQILQSFTQKYFFPVHIRWWIAIKKMFFSYLFVFIAQVFFCIFVLFFIWYIFVYTYSNVSFFVHTRMSHDYYTCVQHNITRFYKTFGWSQMLKTFLNPKRFKDFFNVFYIYSCTRSCSLLKYS